MESHRRQLRRLARRGVRERRLGHGLRRGAMLSCHNRPGRDAELALITCLAFASASSASKPASLDTCRGPWARVTLDRF